MNEENATNDKAQEHDGEANGNANPVQPTSLATVLQEIRDFRKETNQHLNDIRSELTTTNTKITEAETGIGKVEDRVQNVKQVLTKMIKVMNQQESKLLDQESRSQRENLRVYNVPEGAEGSSIVTFIEKILRECLNIPQTKCLGIERAHRALAQNTSGNLADKPRSIVIKFSRFTTKDEILRKAWEKKIVFLEGRQIYFDQDYPAAILKKRRDYAEAKRVLKRHNIRFQTLFPAKLRVFDEEGTWLYDTAKEATADMNARGMPVTVVTPKESLAEQLSQSAWKIVGVQRVGEDREKTIREKLWVLPNP